MYDNDNSLPRRICDSNMCGMSDIIHSHVHTYFVYRNSTVAVACTSYDIGNAVSAVSPPEASTEEMVNVGAIVGGVIGSFFVILCITIVIIIIIGIIVWRRRQGHADLRGTKRFGIIIIHWLGEQGMR